MTIRQTIAASALALFAIGVSAASAAPVFSESFDSGSATFTTGDSYWGSDVAGNSATENGFIIQSTNVPCCNNFGTLIPADASGSGYFLFEGTLGGTLRSGTGPSSAAFYISQSFAVDPVTQYILSFDIANATVDPYQAGVQAVIANGAGDPNQTSFAAVSASPSESTWEHFTMTWNSGTDTTAMITLFDTYTAAQGNGDYGYGNDFGVDNIQLVAVPEAATWTMLLGAFLGFAGFAALRRRKRLGLAA